MDPRKFGRRLAPEGEPGTSNAGTPPPAAPPATPPPSDPKPHTLATDLPPDALKARLDEARGAGRNELLKELGVTEEQLKSALGTVRASEEAKKTTEQKLAEQTVKLTSYEQAVDVAIAQVAATISQEQKAAVDAIAGNDRALWLRTYGALAPTWKVAAPASPAAPAQPAATPPADPPPANTSPAPNAPPATVTSPPNKHAEWAALKERNPIAAARFLEAHRFEIFPSQ